MTPLHAAAGCGHGDVTMLLVKRGADVEVINKVKFTPFMPGFFTVIPLFTLGLLLSRVLHLNYI